MNNTPGIKLLEAIGIEVGPDCTEAAIIITPDMPMAVHLRYVVADQDVPDGVRETFEMYRITDDSEKEHQR